MRGCGGHSRPPVPVGAARREETGSAGGFPDAGLGPPRPPRPPHPPAPAGWGRWGAVGSGALGHGPPPPPPILLPPRRGPDPAEGATRRPGPAAQVWSCPGRQRARPGSPPRGPWGAAGPVGCGGGTHRLPSPQPRGHMCGTQRRPLGCAHPPRTPHPTPDGGGILPLRLLSPPSPSLGVPRGVRVPGCGAPHRRPPPGPSGSGLSAPAGTGGGCCS